MHEFDPTKDAHLQRRPEESRETSLRRDVRPAATGQPAWDTVLQLQRDLGNRYVQRMMEPEVGSGEGGEVSADLEGSIQRARGGGQPLENTTRSSMESAFGTDLSGVRVHTGSEADNLNQAVSARAFTTGQDIFFRKGEYNPGTSQGRELLAHELTHVVQQTGPEIRTKLVVGAPHDSLEREADEVARQVVQREANREDSRQSDS